MGESESDNGPLEWRVARFHQYAGPLDLSGKDLISMFGRSKSELSALTGPLLESEAMPEEELPGEYLRSMTGEIADEIHEWPGATLGSDFHHLRLQFRLGQLIGFSWKFGTRIPPARKRWWKFWG